MNIADRFARLDSREQRLLNTALLVVGVIVVVLVPIVLTILVHGRRSDNQALRDAADSITDAQEQIAKAKLEKKLKSKDAKLQTKIASLSSSEK